MKQDKVLGLILLLFSAFMYYQAEQLPEAMFGALGADVFPKLLFILLALGGLGLIIQAFRKERKLAREGRKLEKKPGPGLAHYKNVIIGFGFFLVYVALMYYVGYVIAALVFLPGFMWILGPKTKKSALIIGAVTLGLTFSLQYLFLNLLKVYLPEGSIF